jgi:hypothetical protein
MRRLRVKNGEAEADDNRIFELAQREIDSLIKELDDTKKARACDAERALRLSQDQDEQIARLKKERDEFQEQCRVLGAQELSQRLLKENAEKKLSLKENTP